MRKNSGWDNFNNNGHNKILDEENGNGGELED